MHYRVYLLDTANHIIRGLDLDCDNDEEALARLEELGQAHAVELWQKARLLKRIEAAEA